MILDKQLALSEAQALTGATTSFSTNVIDLSAIRSNIGAGKDLYVVITVDVAAGGTTPTMAPLIQTDDNDSFSSATTLVTGATYAAAALALSTQIVVPLPLQGMERYLRVGYTLGGTSPTLTVTTHIADNFPNAVIYGSGFSVA